MDDGFLFSDEPGSSGLGMVGARESVGDEGGWMQPGGRAGQRGHPIIRVKSRVPTDTTILFRGSMSGGGGGGGGGRGRKEDRRPSNSTQKFFCHKDLLRKLRGQFACCFSICCTSAIVSTVRRSIFPRSVKIGGIGCGRTRPPPPLFSPYPPFFLPLPFFPLLHFSPPFAPQTKGI